MLCREIISAGYATHGTHKYTAQKNDKALHVTVDNAYSYHGALNSSWDLGTYEINAMLFLLVVVVVVINAEQFHSWGL
jgi:hypothetical protein